MIGSLVEGIRYGRDVWMGTVENLGHKFPKMRGVNEDNDVIEFLRRVCCSLEID